MKKTICLLSGGLDSSVCLYLARSQGYEVVALSIEYGQRHYKEISWAQNMTRLLRVRHYFASLSMPWKGSSLIDEKMKLPLDRDPQCISKEIPSTYVPGRNSVFLSLAMSCAETEYADVIFIGANALDYSGYPDCRPEYLDAFIRALNVGTRLGVSGKSITIEAPLLHMSKKEIIHLGNQLGVPFEQTWSCYAGGDYPCGVCDSCRLRAKGFQEAGLLDPLLLKQNTATAESFSP